jgi:outer membrane protein OmpA-like peptidoglycan-associated protein
MKQYKITSPNCTRPSLLLFITFLFLFFFPLGPASGQQKQYHLVVGGFSNENNAKKFTKYVRTTFYDAAYSLNAQRKLFYVYVYKTSNRKDAFSRAALLQQESEFRDAWVYYGILEDTPSLQPVSVETEISQTTPAPALDHTELPPVYEARASDLSAQPVNAVETPGTNTPGLGKPKGKFFRFVILDEQGQPVNATVHHVDYARGKDLATYPANEYVDVLPPSTANNPMTVVCGVFGYKEVVKQIDYNNPATSGISADNQDAWVVTYPLERMKKGDVSVMYHVSFYKDAVVMLPVSKTEMDELVNLMQRNPAYKIKIHGHCNGNHKRKIIALGADKNYFDNQGSEEKKGTAKALSLLRAEAVRSYLEGHGIERKRIQVYGWGGLQMLVGQNSTNAKLNDRIEIEILED